MESGFPWHYDQKVMSDYYMERAQSAESKLSTLQNAMDSVTERIRLFKMNFGIREKSNGEIDIDFEKFVEKLGPESALELRDIIDVKYDSQTKAKVA